MLIEVPTLRVIIIDYCVLGIPMFTDCIAIWIIICNRTVHIGHIVVLGL